VAFCNLVVLLEVVLATSAISLNDGLVVGASEVGVHTMGVAQQNLVTKATCSSWQAGLRIWEINCLHHLALHLQHARAPLGETCKKLPIGQSNSEEDPSAEEGACEEGAFASRKKSRIRDHQVFRLSGAR